MVSFFWKFLTFPVAFVYFRLRFGRDFFRRPTMCWNCNKAPENGFCPGCGWRMDNTPWGRYMGRSDLGMLEFASVQDEHFTKARQAKELAKTFNQPTPVADQQPAPPVDLTSNLFDD